MGSMRNRIAKIYNVASLIFWLWLEGARHALSFHRCFIYCVCDSAIWRLLVNCILLNGGFFLGSLFLHKWLVQLAVPWLLHVGGLGGVEWAVRTANDVSFYCLWFIPVYLVSFALSCAWYQEIATLAVRVKPLVEARDRGNLAAGLPVLPPPPAPPSPVSVMNSMAADVYRALLFASIMLHVYLASLVPLVGVYLNFVLMAWLYALYCYDYKWSLRKQDLRARLSTLHSNWPFFLGFGSVCSVLLLVFPYLWGAAVMATLYPFFVVMACDSDFVQATRLVIQRRAAGGRAAAVPPLPIFYTSIALTNSIVAHGSKVLQLPALLARHWRLVLASVLLAAGVGYLIRLIASRTA